MYFPDSSVTRGVMTPVLLSSYGPDVTICRPSSCPEGTKNMLTLIARICEGPDSCKRALEVHIFKRWEVGVCV